MDPVTALIIAIWIAGRFTKNVYQDSVYKARGEDPPSFRREQERRQARRESDGGPGRRLLGNAWADACAAADERRARLTARAAERRHTKWADADHDAAEAEAREINERVTTGTETVYVCGGPYCGGARITQSEVAGYALSGDPLCRTCRTAPEQSPPRPRDDGPGEAAEVADPPSTPQEATPGPDGRPEFCPACGQRPGPDEKLVRFGNGTVVHLPCPEAAEDGIPTIDVPAPNPGEHTGGTVTDITEWRSKGTIPPITKEDFVSGETTNLAAAMNYTQNMATQCGEGAVSCETSIATMRAGGVTGEPLLRLTHAQEALLKAQSDFMGSYEALARQVAVKDAYQATPEAGDKQFVTQD